MSVTLKQIAESVGVSQPLVTYALNGKPGVSAVMRAKILLEAERLGYDPGVNRGAQQLAARRHGRRNATGIIAVVCRFGTDLDWPGRQPSRTLLDAIEADAAERELDLFITPAREGSVPRLVRENGVDGVLFVAQSSWTGSQYDEIALPQVTVGALNPATYSLAPDDGAGAHLAANHLMDLGHRRIAYVGLGNDLQGAMRRAAFRRAHRERNREVADDLLVEVPSLTEISGQEAVEHLLGPGRRKPGSEPGSYSLPFTAMVCQHDYLAMGAVLELGARGIRVPEDVSIIGFDAVSRLHHFRPVITSVASDPQAMATRAMESLCAEVARFYSQPVSDWQGSRGEELFPVQLRPGGTAREWPSDNCAI